MVSAAPTKALRCAVYTRKSSDEGLEQEFNSLHAQREACEAYISSQKHEGWQLIPAAYDDGGFSGGSMNRPALQQLLADIHAKLIDVVVVYKVDRLSRSLADFAKMVEVFDAHGVSFVSVTQAFSTTTSMGRLTLNVLLSFAQFEREVTGERIRDKIAASKAKGMWMGGVTPLGYDIVDRKLIVNEAEAKDVRWLFGRYRMLRSADEVVEQAWAKGIRSKNRTDQAGVTSGGCKILRGALYSLLANPVYVGEIAHKEKRFPGQHEPIVSRELFDDVQAVLAFNRRKKRLSANAADPSLLAGLVCDDRGQKLTATHTRKGGRKYRYYVTEKLADAPLRVPAPALEKLVVASLADHLSSAEKIAALLLEHDVAEGLEMLIAKAGEVGSVLEHAKGSALRALLLDLVDRVEIATSQVTVKLKLSAIGLSGTGELVLAARLERRKQELTLVLPGASAEPDASLIAIIGQARMWFGDLTTGAVTSIAELAKREGVTACYVRKILDLAVLAPDIIEQIMEGRQPPHLTTSFLRSKRPLPASWPDQRALLETA